MIFDDNNFDFTKYLPLILLWNLFTKLSLLSKVNINTLWYLYKTETVLTQWTHKICHRDNLLPLYKNIKKKKHTNKRQTHQNLSIDKKKEIWNWRNIILNKSTVTISKFASNIKSERQHG